METHSSILAWKIPCTEATVRRGAKSWTWLKWLSMHAYTFIFIIYTTYIWGFPHSTVGKESACNAGDLGLIPGSGRSPGEGKSYPLQDSCLENSTDRRAMGSQSWTWLSDWHTHTFPLTELDYKMLIINYHEIDLVLKTYDPIKNV